jgi:hypothetical protein
MDQAGEKVDCGIARPLVSLLVDADLCAEALEQLELVLRDHPHHIEP